MTSINIENLMRTVRPLTWLPQPTCDRCSLPFASYSDEREDRLPMLLSCRHLLCGPCVSKHNDAILCDRCNKVVSVPNQYGNVLMALHPSYYMMGMMARMQQELKDIELYSLDTNPKAKELEDAAVVKDTLEDFCIESVSGIELKTPKHLKKLLENAFDVHERTSFAIQKRARTYPDDVDQVINKINAHFLTLHNALQIEQDHVLQLVRKTYLEQRHYTDHQLKHLVASKERLKKLYARAKQCIRDQPASDDKTWLKFKDNVKNFLETERMKLSTDNGSDFLRKPLASFHTKSDNFLKNISTSYRMTLSEFRAHLIPFTATKKREKDRIDVVTSIKEENHSTAPKPTPSTSREKTATTGQRHHHEPSGGRKVRKDSDMCISSNISRTTIQRNKKDSKSNHKSYGSRVMIDTKRQEELKRCFSTVTITCIVNPYEIYVQDELHDGAAKALLELCQTDADEYEAELLTVKRQLNVEAGCLYLVQPVSSARWYRARVLEVLNGGTTSEQLGPYRVQYIDYGGKDTVLHEQIRPISEDLTKIENKAVKCSLYSVVPPNYTLNQAEFHWPEECHQLMMDFVGNRKMLMYEVDCGTSEGGLMVDFFLPPIPSTAEANAETNDTIDVTCWEGYYPPMSLRNTLINLQQCFENLHHDLKEAAVERIRLLNAWMMTAEAAAKKRCTIPSTPELKGYELVDVHITHSKSPDYLYIMPMEWRKNRFDILQQQLGALCQQETLYKVFCPYVGLVCGFALTTQDQNRVWLRGRVVKVMPGVCQMFALDTGESINVPCDDLYMFPPASAPMCEYPLAVCCRLQHIHPKSVGGGTIGTISTWSAEAIEEFNMLTKSKTLSFAVKVGPLWKESNIYDVLLYLRNKSEEDTCINKMLVMRGHAECNSGKEAEIADLARKTDGDTLTVISSSASNAVIDPRVPVDVLNVVSPDKIYVRLSSRKADLDGLHQTIQQYMDEALDGEAGGTDDLSTGWRIGDMCLVFTSLTDGSSIEWYRARIMDVQEDGEQYEAFLIDRALTVQVHRTNVARMVSRIAQLQPGAIRCQLACIEPVKSTNQWNKVAVDFLICMIQSYDKHAISLDDKGPKHADDKPPDAKQSLSVVLWGVREVVREALAPHKTEYRNINQQFAFRGLAHLSGKFRTFPTKGEGVLKEVQSIEEAVEKMMQCEYEKLQQFFRTLATGSTEAEGFGAQEDGNETAKVVLTNGGATQVRVHIDEACASLLSLANDKVERITAWPEAAPIEKTIFVGMPTHIGNDGTVFLYDMCQEPVLHHIRDKINEHVQNSSTSPQLETIFQPGEPCLAKYHLDGLFYRASIVSAVKKNKYRVLFVDYGNEETCQAKHLRKDIICGRVPVQTNRFRLSGIVPKQACEKTESSWPDDALLVCHGMCVQQLCTVRVDTSIWSADLSKNAPVRRPIPCKLFRLKDSIEVNSALLKLEQFSYCAEKDEETDSEYVASSCGQFEPIVYPMTNVDPGPSHLLSLSTPEQRDLMQFMQEIESSVKCEQNSKDFEDPNEIPDDTGVDSDYLNRAQLINFSDNDQQQHEQSYCSLPSPASFKSFELESSTRLSYELDDKFSCFSSGSGAITHGGIFMSPIDWNQTRGFFAEYTNFGSGCTVYVFPHLEGHTQRIARMSENLQLFASSQNESVCWQGSLVEIGSPCIAPYRADGMYYRAVVEAIHEETAEVSVLYVDYLNRDKVAMSALRKCPLELRSVPLRIVEVRLRGVRTNPRLRPGDINQRLMEVLKRPFYVRIVSTKPTQSGETVKPEVEFYTDCDCNILAYQQMIEEKYFYATKPSVT